jgi:hypothetical protein
MVLTVLYVSLSQTDAGSFFGTTLGKASNIYFVLLGGPYAAAVIAKVNNSNQTQNGSVQKSDGSGAINPFDVISDDSGNVSVYDFQYTLFNLVAMVAVLATFVPRPGIGLPAIPDFLAV